MHTVTDSRITVKLLFMNWKDAARSKVWTVFSRSNTGIVGSNPTPGMDVCVYVYSVFILFCVGSGLVAAWSPVERVLPTVYRIKKLEKKRWEPNKGL
jgi:hypothetical protein